MMAWLLLMRLRDHPLKHFMLKESAKHGVALVRGSLYCLQVNDRRLVRTGTCFYEYVYIHH